MRLSTLSSLVVVSGLALPLAGACSDWESLYGKDCDGVWIAADAECPPPVVCGDGRIDEGEECDDANDEQGDGCLSNCVEARCGDGIVWAAVEDCDDGNVDSGDGCSERCRLEAICGDGEVSGAEQCDDDNAEAGDGCSATCQLEPDPLTCGNGSIDENEVCDDGNSSNDDSCLVGCSRATCGDGFLRRGVEVCDDGNVVGGDGCTRTCQACGLENMRYRFGNDHCYKLHEEPLTYDEARAACAAEGAYLWTAIGDNEVSEIHRRLVVDKREVWLGMQVKADGTHTWITGETSQYAPWVDGEPRDIRCAVQYATASSERNFATRFCTRLRPFVCEHEVAKIEPKTHHAYRRWFVELTHDEAIAFCEEQGGALVAFETQEEREFVQSAYRNEYWVNATDPDSPKDCVLHARGELVPGVCDVKRGFVCEFH